MLIRLHNEVKPLRKDSHAPDPPPFSPIHNYHLSEIVPWLDLRQLRAEGEDEAQLREVIYLLLKL